MQRLLIITGPTATGKSALAVRLARHFSTAVISCDSMQIYREFDVGTAKPSLPEREGISHELMDFLSPLDNYSAAQYAEDAAALIRRHPDRVPLFCGGTGFYLSALLFPLDFDRADADPKLREELNGLAEREGKEAVFAILSREDPKTAAALNPNDLKRVIRAIEIFRTTGVRKSEGRRSLGKARYPYTMVGLETDRAALYDRINRRVDRMVENGLYEEFCKLIDKGYRHSQAMQAIGYREWTDFQAGRVSFADTVEKIKQDTRNYAKRQWTFLRKLPGIVWFEAEDLGLEEKVIELYERENTPGSEL